MKKQIKKSNISSLAPLLLFVIFTTCILSVLLTGADVYQNFSKRDQSSFERRTTVQYLTTRIRQSDTEGMVFAGSFDEDPADTGEASSQAGDTLFLREELGGRTFYTRIYCHDGYMYELFSESGLGFSPSTGQKILEVNSLHFTVQDGLIYIDIEYADRTAEALILHLRSGEVSS